VTGGAGFIGSHLVERLLAAGRRVVVIDDLSTGSRDNLRGCAGRPGLEIIEAKIRDCPRLPELAAEAEFIYHLAATVGVELVVQSALHVLESSFHETQLLLQAAAVRRTPLLLTSTSEVYGKSQKPEFSETDDLLIGPPGQSRWSYACAKLTGRYGMVLPRFIASARAGTALRVYGDGAQTRCFCLVTDVVEALVRLPANPAARGEIFNIGGTEEVSMLELARLVVDTLGSRSPVELIPYEQAYAPGFDDMRRRKPRVDKLDRVTGFHPQTSLREIIRLTAAA